MDRTRGHVGGVGRTSDGSWKKETRQQVISQNRSAIHKGQVLISFHYRYLCHCVSLQSLLEILNTINCVEHNIFYDYVGSYPNRHLNSNRVSANRINARNMTRHDTVAYTCIMIKYLVLICLRRPPSLLLLHHPITGLIHRGFFRHFGLKQVKWTGQNWELSTLYCHSDPKMESNYYYVTQILMYAVESRLTAWMP